jgi:hypothetical protein
MHGLHSMIERFLTDEAQICPVRLVIDDDFFLLDIDRKVTERSSVLGRRGGFDWFAIAVDDKITSWLSQ